MGSESGVGTQNPFNLLEDEPSLEDVEQKPDELKVKSAKPKAAKKDAPKGKEKPAAAAAAPAPTGPAKPKKRDHDRHVSGTGRGKEFQKGGAGKHNWGSDQQEAAAIPEEPVADAPADNVAEEPAEKEALGYDEYIAQLNAKRPQDDQEKAEARAPIVDPSFAKGTVFQKDENADVLFGDLVQTKEAKEKSKKKKEKAVVSLDEFVKQHGGPIERRDDRDSRDGASRGGRGGRGGARGGARPPHARGGFNAPAQAPVDGAAAAAPQGAAPAAGAPAGEQRGGFRGGRGGARGGDRGAPRGGARGAPRGGRGRGDFPGAPRGGHRSGPPAGAVDISSQELFPSLAKKN